MKSFTTLVVFAAFSLALAASPLRAQEVAAPEAAAETTDAAEVAAPARILIMGGLVIDGTGAPGRRADVLVEGDKIAKIGLLAPPDYPEARVIVASGKVVTPGFIDTHAHGNPSSTPEFENFLAMGVTTIFLGLDGSSPSGDEPTVWLDEVDAAHPGPNVGLLVGHGSIRSLAGTGRKPEPTPEELQAMVDMAAQAMAQGAFGLSTGLEYDPGRYSALVELINIAQPIGAAGGLVSSHMRSEDDDAIEEAINELLVQCRTSNAGAHISHLKIVYGHGVARAEEILGILDAARAKGMRVSADVYPYTASFTGIDIVFPDWALGDNDYDKVVAERRDELAAHLRQRVTLRNGPEATLFGTGKWSGKTLAQVAEEAGKPYEDVLIDDIGRGGASAAYFVMDEEVMERFLVDPHVMVCSDGSPGMRHPRGYGAFARVLHHFVQERGLLTLEAAVHKMSGLPAETFGLAPMHRGTLAAGNAADILVFDPAKVRDTATFEEPHQLAEGIDTVLVNGVVVRAGGEFTGERAGRALRRTAK